MERLGEGYIASGERELRFSFKPFHTLDDSLFASVTVQVNSSKNQLYQEAKKSETDLRRVYANLKFSLKHQFIIDLLIATPEGLMIFKVLDWSGKCLTTPGEKWATINENGVETEQQNHLAEISENAGLIREFLVSQSITVKSIVSYVLFPSSTASLSFIDDTKFIVGPAACFSCVKGNGLNNELGEVPSYLQWGQGIISSVYSKFRGGLNDFAFDKNWIDTLSQLSNIPKYDVLQFRDRSFCCFGAFEGFQDEKDIRSGSMVTLERICNRQSPKFFKFENTRVGMTGAPIAFVTGNLGWQPLTRIRVVMFPSDPSPVSVITSLDVVPTIKIIFRPIGSDSPILPEVNDIESLELTTRLLVSQE